MLNTKTLIGAIAAAAVIALTPSAHAQHTHAGDIQPGIAAGKITIGGGAETQFGTGYQIFEGSFGMPQALSGQIRWVTDDPGFDTGEPGPMQPGDNLSFRGLGGLKYWNGSNWVAASPQNEFVRVVDTSFPANQINILTSGVMGGTGQIDVADAEGAIHQHIDFFLINNANAAADFGSPVATGAYLIELQLTTTTLDGGAPRYLDSDPFLIAFNRGLSDEAFEASVHALAVPEPSAALMLLPALGLIAWRVRRKNAR